MSADLGLGIKIYCVLKYDNVDTSLHAGSIDICT